MTDPGDFSWVAGSSDPDPFPLTSRGAAARTADAPPITSPIASPITRPVTSPITRRPGCRGWGHRLLGVCAAWCTQYASWLISGTLHLLVSGILAVWAWTHPPLLPPPDLQALFQSPSPTSPFETASDSPADSDAHFSLAAESSPRSSSPAAADDAASPHPWELADLVAQPTVSPPTSRLAVTPPTSASRTPSAASQPALGAASSSPIPRHSLTSTTPGSSTPLRSGTHSGSATGTASSGEGSGTSSGFFGTGTTPQKVVYVVDMSGSMQGRRFRRAVGELVQTIENLRPDQEFHVIFFNDRSFPMFSPQPVSTLVPATSENKLRASRWIRQQRPRSLTNPEHALQLAIDMQPQAIYLLTDGELPIDVVTTTHRHNRQRVVIHTIAFENRDGEPELKRLAQDHHGTYRFIP